MDRWASLTAGDNAATKLARKETALAAVYSYMNAYLRVAGYLVPVAEKDGTTPDLLRWINAELGTVWLLEASGPKMVGRAQDQPGHILWARKLRCEEWLGMIVAGKLKLDARMG